MRKVSQVSTPQGLLAGLTAYRSARKQLLDVLGLPDSCRDPLAEFAERFVAALTGGALATSRVQAKWDILQPNGNLLQVRYLANPADRWVNEHLVQTIPGVDRYALVLFEDMHPTGVLTFPPDLAPICSALGKRHPRQGKTLQFTRRNWLQMRDHADVFTRIGMRIRLPPYTDGQLNFSGTAAQRTPR